MALKLVPPGKRGPCWYIRGSINGKEIEMSCCTIDQLEAEKLLAKVIAYHQGNVSMITGPALIQIDLIPPLPGGFWSIRLKTNDEESVISTNTTDFEAAQAFLADFKASGVAEEHHRRAKPEAMPLGSFEQWLLQTFALVGETVVWRTSGERLVFHKAPLGYLGCNLAFGPFRKKVLAHRLKFLLAHGWLPRSIDHLDGHRWNNQLANLQASTPALQQANVRHRKRHLRLVD